MSKQDLIERLQGIKDAFAKGQDVPADVFTKSFDDAIDALKAKDAGTLSQAEMISQLNENLNSQDTLIKDQCAEIERLKAGSGGPDWEAFGRQIMASYQFMYDVDCSEVFDYALENNIIKEVDGGYKHELHEHMTGDCLDDGDPFYVHNFYDPPEPPKD